MRNGRLLSALMVVSLLTGCNLATFPPANSVNKGAEAAQVLPQSVASAPVTLNVPLRFQNWPHITVFRNGDAIVLSSLSTHQNRWRGHSITIYYVPLQNVGNRYGHDVLKSSADLQEIHTVPISADGSWNYVWHLPPGTLLHTGVHFLVRTDDGQLGLAACKC